jgi:hypothetical protein
VTTGPRRRLIAVAAPLAAGTVCLVVGTLGGPVLARLAVAALVLVAACATVSYWRPPSVTRPPAYRGGRTAARTGYPTYEQIWHKLSWAKTSDAYRANVLEPWLRDLAQDLGVRWPAQHGGTEETVNRLEREIMDETG